MAEDKSIDIKLLNSKKFDDFLRPLGPGIQEGVLESEDLSDFARAVSELKEITPERTIELYEAMGDWRGVMLEQAKWFAYKMGTVTSKDQEKVLNAKNTDDIRQVFGPEAEQVETAMNAWRSENARGEHVEIPAPRTEHVSNTPAQNQSIASSGAADAAAIGIGGSVGSYEYLKNRKYNSFKKEAEEFAKNKAEEWKNHPDNTYAKSEKGARNRAINEYHDKFLAENPEQAAKWAKEHNDPNLSKAIKKKEILEKPNPRRDEKELKKFLEDNDIKNPEKIHRAGGDISQEEATRRLIAATEAARISQQSKSGLHIPPPRAYASTAPSSNQAPPPRSSPPSPTPPPRRRRGGAAASGAKTLVKEGAKNLAKRGVAWLMANPWVLIGVGIAIGILLFIVILFVAIKEACKVDQLSLATRPSIWPLVAIGHATGLCSAEDAPFEVNVPANPPGVTTEKRGPYQIANSDNILYEIIVRYDPAVSGAPPIDNLILFDVPLFENEFVSATGTNSTGEGETGFSYVRWPLRDNQQFPEDYEFNFTLVINPNKEDFRAINAIYVGESFREVTIEYRETDGGGNPDDKGPGTENTGPQIMACDARSPDDIWYGADCLPTPKTCGGRWSDQMVRTGNMVRSHIRAGRLSGSAGTGYNFGDPMCTYNRARLKQVIDDLEPNADRANFWMDITQCEGTPNSFGEQISPMGPAGTFQMNIGQPVVFKKWQESQSIRGDIPWQRQVQVAVEYNNGLRRINKDFEFWGAARCLCWYDGYKDKGYCNDIRNHGLQRSPATCNNNACAELGRRGPQ